MDTYVEDVDVDKVLKFKNFLVDEGGNCIILDGLQNFMYTFSDTVCEVHGSNRGKYVTNLSSGGTSKVSDSNHVKLLSRGILAGLAGGF